MGFVRGNLPVFQGMVQLPRGDLAISIQIKLSSPNRSKGSASWSAVQLTVPGKDKRAAVVTACATNSVVNPGGATAIDGSIRAWRESWAWSAPTPNLGEGPAWLQSKSWSPPVTTGEDAFETWDILLSVTS